MNRQEVGQYYKLSIGDEGSPEIFTPIACITKLDFGTDTNIIDGTSNCGPASKPGFSKSNLSLTAFVDYNTEEDGNISGPAVYDLQIARTEFNFRIEPVDAPAVGDQLIEGNAFVANYKQSFSTDTIIGFDFTLQQQTGNFTQAIWNGSAFV